MFESVKTTNSTESFVKVKLEIASPKQVEPVKRLLHPAKLQWRVLLSVSFNFVSTNEQAIKERARYTQVLKTRCVMQMCPRRAEMGRASSPIGSPEQATPWKASATDCSTVQHHEIGSVS